MDELAGHLSSPELGYRVICPDTIGSDPRNEYCFEFYARLATALMVQVSP